MRQKRRSIIYTDAAFRYPTMLCTNEQMMRAAGIFKRLLTTYQSLNAIGPVHPKTTVQFLSTHPHADGVASQQRPQLKVSNVYHPFNRTVKMHDLRGEKFIHFFLN